MAFLSRATSSRSQTQLLNPGFPRPISSPQFTPVFNCPCCTPPPPSSSSSSRWIKKELRLRVKERLGVVFAANSNDGLVEGKGESKKEKSDAQGPPLLTIVAGLVVFLLAFLLLKSILLGLFGLLVKSPPSK